MIEVRVDATRALARFSPAGIPEAVRRQLRAVVPQLTKRLGDLVEANLVAGLKSRRRLVVKKEMRESPTQIVGVVRTISTSEPRMLPAWLETGTRPHEIVVRRAKALVFFWPKVGKKVAFLRVNHPGFKGILYTASAFAAMEEEIRAQITQAVQTGARAA